MNESGTDDADCRRKVASGGKVTGTLRSLVNARVLHDSLLVLVLLYGSEIVIRGEKERSKIRTMQMDNLRGLWSIRRMDRVPNTRISVLWRVAERGG